MYTPDQVEQMILQHCKERLHMSDSMFYNYKAWSSHSLCNLSGMDSLDALEFGMFTENTFGVTMSEDELYHLSLESIIKKCVSLQKPKPAPTPQTEQAKPQPVAAKPQAEQAKTTSEQDEPKPAPKPQAEQAKPKVKQAKPKTTTKPKVGQAKSQPVATKPQVEQVKSQPVATKPAEQPQVETKTMAGMMVCKLLGDVCNRRPTGKPNYDAQNWCEFVDCVLFTNFQKLR